MASVSLVPEYFNIEDLEATETRERRARSLHILNNRGLASFNDEPSASDIYLLLHKLQLFTSGLEEDMGH